MSNEEDKLLQALRNMPAPDPDPQFVERALAKATSQESIASSRARGLWRSWELWVGAALGGTLAAALTFFMVRSSAPSLEEPSVSMALNETREINVIIDSERPLDDATIHIAVTGAVALDGFENERQIDWQADLDRGPNLLTLPVVAREKGNARLVAIVEHEGKRRTIAVDLEVTEPKA